MSDLEDQMSQRSSDNDENFANKLIFGDALKELDDDAKQALGQVDQIYQNQRELFADDNPEYSNGHNQTQHRNQQYEEESKAGYLNSNNQYHNHQHYQNIRNQRSQQFSDSLQDNYRYQNDLNNSGGGPKPWSSLQSDSYPQHMPPSQQQMALRNNLSFQDDQLKLQEQSADNQSILRGDDDGDDSDSAQDEEDYSQQAAVVNQNDGAKRAQQTRYELPILFQTRSGERIYRYTEMYMPVKESTKEQMISYNNSIIFHSQDDDNEKKRERKRQLKEQYKRAQEKLKGKVKYCDPSHLMEDFYFLQGTSSKLRGSSKKQQHQHQQSLQQIHNSRYNDAYHINKVTLPAKRAARQMQMNNAAAKTIYANQSQMTNQTTIEKQEDPNKTLQKLITSENACDQANIAIDEANVSELKTKFSTQQTDDIQTQDDSQAGAAMKSPEINIDENMQIEEIQPEKVTVESVMKKLKDNENLSLEDLSAHERSILKLHAKKTAADIVQQKYPQPNIKPIIKQCFTFMKKLNQKDFSIDGVASAYQSQPRRAIDQEDLMQDALDDHENHEMHANFDTSVNYTEFTYRNEAEENDHSQKEEANAAEPSDDMIQQWTIEHRYKLHDPTNGRKLYWGEPKNCSSQQQLDKDHLKYRKLLDNKAAENQTKKKNIFSIFEVASEDKEDANKKGSKNIHSRDQIMNSSSNHQNSSQINQSTNPESVDIQEYEFMQTQKKHFYQDDTLIRDKDFVQSIMRHTMWKLGELPDAQFYELECQSIQAMKQQASSQKHNPTNLSLTYHKQQQSQQLPFKEIVDDFDNLFDSKQRELNDQLFKKIQRKEKANQQGAKPQTTTAYEPIKWNINGEKDGRIGDQINQKDHHKESELSSSDADMDDQDNGGGQDLHVSSRVHQSLARELNHAKCIMDMSYFRFTWRDKHLLRFHRPNIEKAFIKLQKIAQGSPFTELRMKIIDQEQINKKQKTTIIHPHEHFKDRIKLSLRSGKYCIFEHIDQNPLFVNNFGMASRLKRFYYGDKVPARRHFTQRQENKATRHMGPHGDIILKKRGEKLELLGQIDLERYKGITVFENQMYMAPLFYQQSHNNDFFCTISQDKRGKQQIIVRELQDLYTVGQLEPKRAVFNPQSRNYQHFLKRRTQAYVIKFIKENHNAISFQTLKDFFPYIHDPILKKFIKEIEVEVDRNQNCQFTTQFNEEKAKDIISPEEICMFESAQFGQYLLNRIGIKEISSADKISYSTNKFCLEETDSKLQNIAKLIESEVLSTPWHLSDSFISNKKMNGMMMLRGKGDPSNDLGGYSFLKLPLKISQDSLSGAQNNRKNLNPAIQNPKAVTGTDADLRKLTKETIQNKLLELGKIDDDQLQKMTRWEMVAYLRDQSSQNGVGVDEEMKKYARGVRFTSKKQQEMYFIKVNEIFKKQMDNLSSLRPSYIHDESFEQTDFDSDTKQVKIYNEEIQNHMSTHRYSIEGGPELKEIKNIKELKDHLELLLPKLNISGANNQTQSLDSCINFGGNSAFGNNAANQSSVYNQKQKDLDLIKKKLEEGELNYKVEVLRKKVKSLKSIDDQQFSRIIYSSDEKTIKKFRRRQSKCNQKIKRSKKTKNKIKFDGDTQIKMPTNINEFSSSQVGERGGPQSKIGGGASSSVVQFSLNNAPSSQVEEQPIFSQVGNKISLRPATNTGSATKKSKPQTLKQLKKDNISLISNRKNQYDSEATGSMYQSAIVPPLVPEIDQISAKNSSANQKIQLKVTIGGNSGANVNTNASGSNSAAPIAAPQKNLIGIPTQNSDFSMPTTSQKLKIDIPQYNQLNPASQPPQMMTDFKIQPVVLNAAQTSKKAPSKINKNLNSSNSKVVLGKATNNRSAPKKEKSQSKNQGARIQIAQPPSSSVMNFNTGGNSSGTINIVANNTATSASKSSAKKTPTPITATKRQVSTGCNKEDFEGYKSFGTSSRKRQKTCDVALNEIFESIINQSIDVDNEQGGYFVNKVTKKEAPNYYDHIKNPIALRDMKCKARRYEYKNSELFKIDFELLRANAELFNGQTSRIAELARNLESQAMDQFEQRKEDIMNLEAAIQHEQNMDMYA